MAFNLDCVLDGYEFRGWQSGKLDDGGAWYKMILEAPDSPTQLRVTVPKDLWPDVSVMGLEKGDQLYLKVEASAGTYNGQHYDRVRLIEMPRVIDENGEII